MPQRIDNKTKKLDYKITKSMKTPYLRGISSNLAEKFKDSPLCNFINSDENLLACIRNNAIGIYHLSDRVAMINFNRDKDLVCKINDYYISGEHTGKEHRHTIDVICEKISDIKNNSLKRITPEKKAQHTLVRKTNSNPDAEWYCVDIEYRQSRKVQNDNINAFNGRFDIIAISKNAPHRIAIIELKYNSSAISGSSSISKISIPFPQILYALRIFAKK